MKYYRDLKPDEPLQAGDERLCIVSLTWSPIAETAVGWQVVESAPLYRRPVNQPMLQRITPEAMAELEGRGPLIMLFKRRDAPLYRYEVAVYNKWLQGWFGDLEVNPLDWQWYIELDTIPEVMQ